MNKQQRVAISTCLTLLSEERKKRIMADELNLEINPGPQRVNIEQLTHDLQFDQALLMLHEARHKAHMNKAIRERSFIRNWYQIVAGVVADDVPTVRGYLEAHDAYARAESDIFSVEIQQLKARIAIKGLLLDQAKNPQLVKPATQ
jgi:hypothetical protein